jgi:hypothetical protein
LILLLVSILALPSVVQAQAKKPNILVVWGDDIGWYNVDVAVILDELAAKNPEKLDWKKSIVDLMKLVGMDSSFGARKQLAKELDYTGDPNDSASMNIWLHKEVLRKLSENGGKVPAELLA